MAAQFRSRKYSPGNDIKTPSTALPKLRPEMANVTCQQVSCPSFDCSNQDRSVFLQGNTAAEVPVSDASQNCNVNKSLAKRSFWTLSLRLSLAFPAA
jgi:hypothetical protein